jgi:hypothetical protein
MLAMSKRKPKRKEPEMPATSSPPRPGQRALGVYIDDKLAAALSAYLGSTRPKTSKTAVVEVALEEFLAGRGYWPWPAQAEN